MPTYYTYKLYEGEEVTFKDFAISCARFIDFLSSMRDEPGDVPIPEEIVPRAHYGNSLFDSEVQLAQILGWTESDAEREAQKAFEEQTQEFAKESALSAARRARFLAMLEQVEAWKPPTLAHEGLKKFMASQIRDGLRLDCRESDFPSPVRQTGSVFKTRRLIEATDESRISREMYTAEVERAKTSNEWVRALRASLVKEEP